MEYKEKIEKYDKENSLKSLNQLPDQFEQTWEEVLGLTYPPDYRNVKNIVISGMGGSAYSYYVVQSLFGDQLDVPIILSNSYGLPKFVGEDTLVIASSYSGTTEEVIDGAMEALKRGSKLTFISSGGKLKEIAKQNNLLGFFFNAKHNPSKQPRMGAGYMILGTIGILRQTGLITLEKNIVLQGVNNLREKSQQISKNAVEKVHSFKNKYLMYIAAEHLAGNAHIIRNQTNETAKQFAMYALIPELNHHLMEGLSYPAKNKPYFIFITSDNYSKNIKKRFKLTEEVVKKNGASTEILNFDHPSRFSEFMTVLSYGGYLTFYLAMEYRINPAEIPWVDYFKGKLVS